MTHLLCNSGREAHEYNPPVLRPYRSILPQVAATAFVGGMTVPPRSLVMGSPARVRRDLTIDEVSSIQQYADHYVQYNEYLSS